MEFNFLPLLETAMEVAAPVLAVLLAAVLKGLLTLLGAKKDSELFRALDEQTRRAVRLAYGRALKAAKEQGYDKVHIDAKDWQLEAIMILNEQAPKLIKQLKMKPKQVEQFVEEKINAHS